MPMSILCLALRSLLSFVTNDFQLSLVIFACRSLGAKISKRQLAKLFESFPWREENGSWDKLQVPPPVEPNAYVNDAKVKCA